MAPMGYSGDGGKLIHEKTKSRTSCVRLHLNIYANTVVYVKNKNMEILICHLDASDRWSK